MPKLLLKFKFLFDTFLSNITNILDACLLGLN